MGQLWGAEDAYLDLAASAADAVDHFRGQKDHGMEELFWSQFLGAVPHIGAMKRSACIEGARMALARVKTYWRR